MSPSVSIVFQSMLTVLGSRNLKSLTGSFMRRAAPYKLFSSIYISDLSLCPTLSGKAYRLLAVTMCILQNASPPRILFSNNRYISGDGHNEMFRFIFFSAADSANCDMVNVHRPNRSALGLIIENFHIHHTIGAHPFPSSVSYN